MSAFDPKRTFSCQICCDAQHSPQGHPLWRHAINFGCRLHTFQGRHPRAFMLPSRTNSRTTVAMLTNAMSIFPATLP